MYATQEGLPHFTNKINTDWQHKYVKITRHQEKKKARLKP